MASDAASQPEKTARLHLISSDNEFFKEMLDSVPATFYFGGTPGENLYIKSQSSSKDGKADKSPKGNLKRPLDELSFKAKAKRAKYDPDQMKTVTRVQELMLQREEEAQENAQKGKKNKKKRGIQELKSTVENAEDLRERLQAKIELLRAKRQGTNNEVDRKRMRRQESKMKLKMRRQEEKKNPANKDGTHKGALALVNGGMRPKQASPPPGKPIYNKEGKMVFSKFDFSESPSKDKKSESSSKNFKQLLEKVVKEKADMKKLKESDLDAAHTASKKAAWKKALQKAEGMKVKDDPELLKKSIKKLEKKKKKSASDWTDRKEKVEAKMKERQDKRGKNIQAKKKSKVDKKIKKAKKKGRILPGF